MNKFVALLGSLLFVIISASPALAAGELTIFIWSEYMNPKVIQDFEDKYKVKVRLTYYESNEEMVAKLQSGGLGQYDLIVPSTYIIPSLKSLDLIQPLNHKLLTNIGNLDPTFSKLEADPGHKYTVPYQWGTSGIAVRSKDISKVKPSLGLLFDPKAEVGSFIIFDTARDAIGAALKYLGYSLNSTNIEEIKEAVALLIATKKRGTFMGFDGGVGGLNKVLGGAASAAQVYNGEAMRGQEEDPEIHYILPIEGAEIWTDLLAIPQKAPNLDNAHLFINYILEGKVGAELATYNNYATPNMASRAFVPKEDLENPVLYPDLTKHKGMEYIKDLGPDTRIYDEAWTAIKTN